MLPWRHHLLDSPGTADFLNLMKIKQKAFLDKMTYTRNGTVLASLMPSIRRAAHRGKVSAQGVFRSSLLQIRRVEKRATKKRAGCPATTQQLQKGGRGTSLMMSALQESRYTTSNPLNQNQTHHSDIHCFCYDIMPLYLNASVE